MAESNMNSEMEFAENSDNSESTSSSDEELTTDLHKEAEKVLPNVIDELSKKGGRVEANKLIREFKKDHKLSIKELTSLFLIVWPTVAVKKFPNLPHREALKRCQVWMLIIMSDSGVSLTDFQPAEAASFTLKAAGRLLKRAKKHVTDTSTSDYYWMITPFMAAILTLEERDVWQQLQDVETSISTEQRQFKLRDYLDSETKIANDGEITLVEVFVNRSDGSPHGNRYSVPYKRITDGPLTIDSVISVDIDQRDL